MSKQHPTPWGISESSGLLIDANGRTVIGSPDIQRLIVVRVNACHSIPAYQLIGENDEPNDLGAMIDVLRQQRDDLLSALSELLGAKTESDLAELEVGIRMLSRHNPEDARISLKAINAVRNVIAKAEAV